MNKKTKKNLKKMPERIVNSLYLLMDDLEKGPVKHTWPNYSKIGVGYHHCHLSPDWVACWKIKKEKTIIEVYYAGSRENAPY